ncbi:MAG: transposase [Cyclobacteriaceae bacterium]|nr:transposase [Cyclobacteriaceae bacterium]
MKKQFKIQGRRTFSETLRKQIVGQIERFELSVTEVSREYEVSKQSVYRWLYKYSRNLEKGTRIVMEKDSQDKRLAALEKRNKELEAAYGRKALEADLYRTMVELASDELKVDLKKTFGDRASK